MDVFVLVYNNTHFLGNISTDVIKRGIGYPEAAVLFPPPPRAEWLDTFSLVINRNPFSRLVSLFHDKYSPSSTWRPEEARWIVKKYRTIKTRSSLGSEETPEPVEFIQ